MKNGIKFIIPKKLKNGAATHTVTRGDEISSCGIFDIFASDYEMMEISVPSKDLADGLERFFTCFGIDFSSYTAKVVARNLIAITDERSGKEVVFADEDQDVAELRRNIIVGNYFAAQKLFEKLCEASE